MHAHGLSSHHMYIMKKKKNQDAKIRLPLRPFLLRSLYPSPPSRHEVSTLTHIRPSPVPKSVILFRFKPCRLLIWNSTFASTRFTVSVFDRRVYATPSVDVISFLAIERRFGVKLAVYDAGFPWHTHKNDVNTPLVVDVYLSLTRRDYINVTINWEML